MPHRLVTVTIVLFWLVMTGWLVYREVVPYWLAEDVPTMQVDLTDEIGSPLVGWRVFKQDQRIGTANSKVVRRDDRSYEFRASYHFEKLNVGMVNIRNMEHVYRVNEDGKLKSLSAKFGVNIGKDPEAFPVANTLIEMQGEVEDNMLEPRFLIEKKLFSFGKIDMSEQGSIVNPMLLVNRVRGLRDKKSWKITMVDPFRTVIGKFLPALVQQSTAVTMLIAEVRTESLFWDNKLVACYVIDYIEPGKIDVTARTWVRKLDGLVLQQEANRDSFDLVLKRVPN